MKTIFLIKLISVMLILTGCKIVVNKPPKELRGVKVASPPIIDGKLDDAAWKKAPRGTDFTDRNADGAPAKDQSVIRLIYTDKAIYVAWYLYDEKPDQLVAFETEDQVRPWRDDWISFTIDLFHTHQFRDRRFFRSNPLGVKFVSHPLLNVPIEDVPELWNVAANIVEDGWIVEMEIPWGMLDYPETTQRIDIGINFDRGHARTGANTWWSKVGFIEDDRMDGHWVNVLPPSK